ncbi:MAG: HAD family phosphatase [Firmicutes bacterium]|nr:HAD family phosphatase [Bacillota bacterium]
MTIWGQGRIRLVAIDIDYTLIGSDLKISDATKRAIGAAIDAGSIITLATGRMYRAAVPFAEELGIDAPLITYDGALVKTARTQEVYWHKPIPLEDAGVILAHLESLGFHINVYVDDELYVASLNEQARHYMAHVNVVANPVENLLEFLNRPPTKLLMMAEPETVDKLLPELERKFGDRSHVARSLPSYIEFTGKGVTKGSALAGLSEHLGIPKDGVMAIGDSENDISMLSYAGIGVAVNNARDSVKEAADYVADGISGDGVAEAIYRFVLGS